MAKFSNREPNIWQTKFSERPAVLAPWVPLAGQHAEKPRVQAPLGVRGNSQASVSSKVDPMLRRFAPILIPAMIAAIGIAILIRGLLLPPYTVPDGNEQLFGESWSHKQVTEPLIQQWNELREKIATRHFVYCDLGWSIILLGGTISAIVVTNRAWTSAAFREIPTPKSKGIFYTLAAITWLSFVPAQIFWVSFLDARESPPFIDDMGGPFIAMLTCGFGGIGLPVILFGAWFVMWRKPVPVPIWSPSTAPGFATFAVWIALILAVLVTAGCVLTEPPLVPSCVFTVYLLLCGRAISVIPAQITTVRGFEVVQRSIPHQ